MSVLPRQLSRPGASPSPTLRQETVNPSLVLAPALAVLEEERREQAQIVGSH